MIKRTLQVLALVLLPALLLASLYASVLAAGPVVNTAIDENDNSCTDGDCSLRDAIATAANGDTITFDGDMTIYLDSTLYIFDRQLTIDGGNHTVTVSGDTGGDGSPNVQVFYVGGNSTTHVTLTYLNISSGTTDAGVAGGGIGFSGTGALAVISSTLSGNSSSYGGGGIGSTSPGTVTVQGCTFSGNSAPASGSYGGAGIFNSTGTLIVQDSTFSGNSGKYGGGISNHNDGTVTVKNSTFSGNSADWGGGIYNNATLTVQNSTFYGNSATYLGGGIMNNSGTTNLSNSLIANSTFGGDCYGLSAGTNNLVKDGSCSASLTGNPLLGPLADNGGATLTMAPLPGSPVIDAGAGCLPADQRGIARPQGTACDIGAFESQGFTLTYGGGSDQRTLVNTPFANPLTLTVSSSAGEPVDGGRVIFTAPASGAGLSTSPLTATISGGTVSQAVTANATNGSYVVTATTRGTLSSAISYALTNAKMSMIGNAHPIDDGDTSPTTEDHTDFGTLVLGQSLTRTFTIRNSGTAALSLTGSPLVAITGPAALDFSLVLSPTTPIAGGGSTTFQVRFTPSLIGTRTATLTIASNDIDENPYDFAIQGTGSNTAPVADAGNSQAVTAGSPVTLDGSDSSDPDGHTPLTYGWVQTGGPTVTLSNAGAASPTFTAPGHTAVLTFTLTVTDSFGLVDLTPDEIVITVTNQAPVANAGSNQDVALGSSVTLDGSGSSDPDGHTPLTYGWIQTGGPTVTLSNPGMVNPTFTAPATMTVLTFTLTVTDSFGLVDPTPDEVVVTIDIVRLYIPLILKG